MILNFEEILKIYLSKRKKGKNERKSNRNNKKI